MGYGPQIGKSSKEHPDGLLLHESLMWSVFPMHVGIDDIPEPRGFAQFAPVHPARGAMFGSAADLNT
jgi:hypothetical protein